uniref:Uncharacterized protein n=1 Tax=Rhizophora mucronata TaxID=61149 RepID=A0A2P2QGA4_RHIMU
MISPDIACNNISHFVLSIILIEITNKSKKNKQKRSLSFFCVNVFPR